jgi:predicted transcriptional regulator
VADRLHALAYHARREKQEIVQTALEAYLASEGA